MDGVTEFEFELAVAMVISTMHEKLCTDLHTGQFFFKSSSILSSTQLVGIRTYHSNEAQLYPSALFCLT